MGGWSGTAGNMVLAQQEIWWGGLFNFSVTSSPVLDCRQLTLDFGLSTWSWTGLGLDFRLTIVMKIKTKEMFSKSYESIFPIFPDFPR